MEFRTLKTFQIVAEKLNITMAAKELKYTQPAVTLQIQSLEKKLNQKLLTRVGNKTFLTAAGKKLKVHADHLLAYVEEIEQDMHALKGPSGVLTIAAPEYYYSRYLTPILNSYTKIYPEVRPNILPLNSNNAIQSVRNNVADIAVVASDYNGIDLRKGFLEEEQILLVASVEISKHQEQESIISNYPFVSYNDDCSFSEIIDIYFEEHGTTPKSIIKCGGSDDTVKQVVTNNIGYAMLAENVITKELSNGSITIIDRIENPIITSSINLKVRSHEPNIQTFYEHLQNTWSLVKK